MPAKLCEHAFGAASTRAVAGDGRLEVAVQRIGAQARTPRLPAGEGKGSIRYYGKPGHPNLIRVDFMVLKKSRLEHVMRF